jgi:hypothetical protein
MGAKVTFSHGIWRILLAGIRRIYDCMSRVGVCPVRFTVRLNGGDPSTGVSGHNVTSTKRENVRHILK